jgi:hypothetical protein
MPSEENNPWETFPQDPDNIGQSPVNIDKSPCKCPDDRCKLTVDDPRHGTINGYSNHKCKCRPCRDAGTMQSRQQTGLDLDAPIIPIVDQQNVLNMIPVENILNDPDDPRHGTLTGHAAGCRCEKCRNAKSEYDKQFNLNLLQKMQNDPNHKNHGTTTGYKVGCRCENCKDTYSKYQRQWRKRKNSFKWYHESSNGKCLSCGVLVLNPMNTYCPVCQNIMAQGDSDAYMQVNPRHPEARPFQKPHDYSGNE